MVWLPVIYLPHGGRIVWTKPNSESFFSLQIPHTHIINTKTVLPILNLRKKAWQHICEIQYAAWKVMLSHSNETLAAAECFWICLLPNCSTGGGGKRCRAEWLYEAAGLHWMYGSDCLYWDRHSAHNLSCYQMSWEEDSEWGITHSFSHLSSNFPLHYFCHYTPVSWSQWWNLYFGWQVSAWLHLMSNKWFIIQTDHVRSVRRTFRFDIDH